MVRKVIMVIRVIIKEVYQENEGNKVINVISVIRR